MAEPRTVLVVQIARNSKAMRFLPCMVERGWRVILLTMEKEEMEFFDRYTRGVEVVKVKGPPLPENVYPGLFALRKRLLVPEFHLDFVARAFRRGLRMIREEHVDVILSTTPYESFLAGHLLSARTGVPWVADYADPWTGNFHYYRPPNRLARSLDLALERRVTSSAAFVTPITDFEARYLEEVIGIPRGRMRVLPLGFSADDYEHARRPERPKDRLAFLHLGTFYPQYSLAFFEALRAAVAERPDLAAEVVFVGNVLGDRRARIEAMGLGDRVTFLPPVPYYDAMGWLLWGDVSLLLTGGEETRELQTTKLVEYLGAGKPVLAVGPKGGRVDDIVTSTGAGPSFAVDDVEGIKGAILALADEFGERGRVEARPDAEAVARLDACRITDDLLAIFEEVMEGG